MSRIGQEMIRRLTEFAEYLERKRETKMAKKWIERVVDETPEGRSIEVVCDRYGSTMDITTAEVRELLEYMEYLEEQDALELLREQG